MLTLPELRLSVRAIRARIVDENDLEISGPGLKGATPTIQQMIQEKLGIASDQDHRKRSVRDGGTRWHLWHVGKSLALVFRAVVRPGMSLIILKVARGGVRSTDHCERLADMPEM